MTILFLRPESSFWTLLISAVGEFLYKPSQHYPNEVVLYFVYKNKIITSLPRPSKGFYWLNFIILSQILLTLHKKVLRIIIYNTGIIQNHWEQLLQTIERPEKLFRYCNLLHLNFSLNILAPRMLFYVLSGNFCLVWRQQIVRNLFACCLYIIHLNFI